MKSLDETNITEESAEATDQASEKTEETVKTAEQTSEKKEETAESAEEASETGEETAVEEESLPLPEEEEINLSDDEIVGALESMLFCTGSSIEIKRLAECLNCAEEDVLAAADKLTKRYGSERSGLELLRLEDSLQLGTKKSYYNVLKRLVGTPKKASLTETMLETLSIVAYKQPVTRLEIENIRGVSCNNQINRLLEYDLIKELGRLDAPGKPLLFGTTEKFLKSFGVSSIDDLPMATPDEIERFKEEAEQEIQEVKV